MRTVSGIWAALGALLAACVLTAPTARANPLPEPGQMSLYELMRQLPDEPTPENQSRFVALLRMFPGYAVTLPGNRRVIESNFDVFQPLFISAQKPGMVPSVNGELQSLYFELADEPAREDMIEVLRSWLVAPSEPAPAWSEPASRDGDVVFPVQLEARVTAAELLSDLGDGPSRALIETIVDSLGCDSVHPHGHCWYLEQAIRRLDDPRSACFLRSGEDGLIELCRGADEVESVSFEARAKGRPPVQLDGAAVGRVFAALAGASVRGPRSVNRGAGYRLTVRFPDGLEAVVRLMAAGLFHYSDNSRVVGYELGIDSAGLYDIFADLGEIRVSQVQD